MANAVAATLSAAAARSVARAGGSAMEGVVPEAMEPGPAAVVCEDTPQATQTDAIIPTANSLQT